MILFLLKKVALHTRERLQIKKKKIVRRNTAALKSSFGFDLRDYLNIFGFDLRDYLNKPLDFDMKKKTVKKYFRRNY